MLAQLDAPNRRIDRVVIAACLLLSIAAFLRIEGVDLGRTAAQPQENTGIRLALRQRRSGHRRRARLHESASRQTHGTIANSGEFINAHSISSYRSRNALV